MKLTEQTIAQGLLDIQAVMLRPQEPFILASGWKSPIYCDNRKTLSHVSLRTQIKEAFLSLIKEKVKEIDVIAGVATGAIPQGALVADAMQLPFVYVRSSPKDHGLQNLVEGELHKGDRVVIIEDLVSTGSSSLKAVHAVREKGCEVKEMFAIFTYFLPIAMKGFEKEGVKLTTLTNYNVVLEEALKRGLVSQEDIQELTEWRKDPENWRK